MFNQKVEFFAANSDRLALLRMQILIIHIKIGTSFCIMFINLILLAGLGILMDLYPQAKEFSFENWPVVAVFTGVVSFSFLIVATLLSLLARHDNYRRIHIEVSKKLKTKEI